MIELSSLPAAWMLLGAYLVAVLGGRARAVVALLAPLVAGWAAWQLSDGSPLSVTYLGFTLEPLYADATRRLFATIFCLMAFTGVLFSLYQSAGRELAAALAYAGGALGVCFAGDLFTLFLFWEVMAVFSTLLIWNGTGSAARGAGLRYAVLHFLGGVVLMTGIIWLWVDSGSLAVRSLELAGPATWLVLLGVLVNAAAPPFSAWVADAYPEASPGGSVFLSAFTTKTAVLVLMLLFPGTPILIGIGLFMVFYGIVYALLENDMRRILAYSIVNQVGFMVCAIGIGTEMALNGAAAHAFAHIIYKALLLMSAGAVLWRTGRRKCTELGGLYHSMPFTTACGIIGALAISAFPFTSGFVSKSLTSQAAADLSLTWVWLALTAASAGVFLHAGIKFPWFVFFQRDSGLRPADPPLNMRLAMGLFALLCVGLGCFPDLLYGLLPYPVEYQPYTAAHLVSQFQLLLFSGLAFFALLPAMRRTLTITLDFDWFYRVPLKVLAESVGRGLSGAGAGISAGLLWCADRVPPLQRLLPATAPAGQMILVLLAAFLAALLLL